MQSCLDAASIITLSLSEKRNLLFIAIVIFLMLIAIRCWLIARRREYDFEMLSEQYSDVLNKNAEMKKMISIISHDLTSTLNFQHILIRNAFTKQRYNTEEQFDAISSIYTNSSRVYLFARSLLEWIITVKKSTDPRRTAIDLVNVVEETLFLFHEMIVFKKNRVITSYCKDCIIEGDIRLLPTVIRNIIDNAVKYTENEDIRIEIKEDENYFVFEVEDKGVGFNVEKVMSELDNFSNSDLSSLGMKIITDLLKKSNLAYDIQSQESKGTRFRIFFPKPIGTTCYEQRD